MRASSDRSDHLPLRSVNGYHRSPCWLSSWLSLCDRRTQSDGAGPSRDVSTRVGRGESTNRARSVAVAVGGVAVGGLVDKRQVVSCPDASGRQFGFRGGWSAQPKCLRRGPRDRTSAPGRDSSDGSFTASYRRKYCLTCASNDLTLGCRCQPTYEGGEHGNIVSAIAERH